MNVELMWVRQFGLEIIEGKTVISSYDMLKSPKTGELKMRDYGGFWKALKHPQTPSSN